MSPTETKTIRRPRLEKAFGLLWWGIVGSGIAIRLAVYLHNRSLWVDEAMLAVNVIDRSYSQLLGRLDLRQVAPPLLLLTSKLSYALWGQLEYSLRLLPLVAGCLALYLFARMTYRLLPNGFGLCAVVLFSLGFESIDWATNFKHYSLDELATVLVLLATVGWEQFSPRRRLIVAALLPWTIWMSYTSSFLLVGLVLVALASWLRKWDRARLLGLLMLMGSAAAAAASVYMLSMRHSFGHKALGYIWAASFPGKPVLPWLGQALINVFGAACDMSYAPALALALCVFGALSLPKSDNRPVAILAAGTLCSAVLASFVHAYPLAGGRLSIYWAPIALLLLASGLRALHDAFNLKSLRRFVVAIAGIIAVASVYMLLQQGSTLLVREEMRDVLTALEQHDDGQTPILVSAAANAQFRVYASPKLLRRATYMKGWLLPTSEVYRAWLRAGQPARFWLIVTGIDLNRKDALEADLGPFARAVRTIQRGRCAALSVKLLPKGRWPRAQ